VRQKGFTLVEMMIVVAILALVAAIAIPNYRASQNRAREASVKSNMHTFQLAAEDYRVRGERYAPSATELAPILSEDIRNPFDRARGENAAWEDRSSMAASPGPRVGIVSYADSGSGGNYNIKGRGARNVLSLVLVASLPDVRIGPGSGPPVDTTTFTPTERRRSH
jgi:prepilin-type N-terminal cleavage/methylation domain-containing protein